MMMKSRKEKQMTESVGQHYRN